VNRDRGRSARRHIATLRAKEPNVKVEIRWCPSHQGIGGPTKGLASSRRTSRMPTGLNGFRPQTGTARSARESSRQAKVLRKEMAGRQRLGQGEACPHQQPQIPAKRKQKPDPTVAKANKRLASRFYQLKTGHCLTGQYLAWTTRRPDATCWWCQYKIQTREHLFKNCPQWKSQQKTLWATVREETRKLPGPTRARDRTNIAEPLADERCSQAVPDSDNRRPGPPVANEEDDAASEAAEWEARERAERDWERVEEEDRLGAEF